MQNLCICQEILVGSRPTQDIKVDFLFELTPRLETSYYHKMGKIYAVRKGRQTGIFNTWAECEQQTKGFSGAEHQSFPTREQAEVYLIGSEPSIHKKTGKLPSTKCLESSMQQLSLKGNMGMPMVKHEQHLPVQRLHQEVVIYTDGSCTDEKGGWAYVVHDRNGDIIKERSGEMPDYPTTNNRAELMAIFKVLDENHGDLTIRPDSDYSIKSVSVWWKGWKARGWKKADGKTPDNLDLIKEIIRLQEGRNITYDHVYAHTGNIYNERCDQLAKAAYQI